MTPTGRSIPYPASEVWLPDGPVEPVSCALHPGNSHEAATPVAAPVGQKTVISSGHLDRTRIHPGLTKKSAAAGNVAAIEPFGAMREHIVCCPGKRNPGMPRSTRRRMPIEGMEEQQCS